MSFSIRSTQIRALTTCWGILSTTPRRFGASAAPQDDAKGKDDKDAPPRRRSAVARTMDRLQSSGSDTLGKRLRPPVERLTLPNESYQAATRKLAEGFTQRIPWMSAYRDQGVAGSSEGYTVLGTVGRIIKEDQHRQKQPSSIQDIMTAEFQRIRESSVRQINAQKRYLPSKDTYSPADLNPYKRKKARAQQREATFKRQHHKGSLLEDQAKLEFTDTQVRREIDFKSIAMMQPFVGKQGCLLGRRKGHIRAVTQRKVVRAIKNARQMALMPHIGMHPAFMDETTKKLQEIFDHLQAKAGHM